MQGGQIIDGFERLRRHRGGLALSPFYLGSRLHPRPSDSSKTGQLVTTSAVYILKATTKSAMAPRPAMKPAMMPAIEYGMGPASARSAFMSWRC